MVSISSLRPGVKGVCESSDVVLGAELRFSARTLNVFKCWPIFPARQCFLFLNLMMPQCSVFIKGGYLIFYYFIWRVFIGRWEKFWWIKYLPHKSQDPRIHVKAGQVWHLTCNPRIQKAEKGSIWGKLVNYTSQNYWTLG